MELTLRRWLRLIEDKAFNKHLKSVKTKRLQSALGHSSLNVSLTYLRGLEIAELAESDMPSINYL